MEYLKRIPNKSGIISTVKIPANSPVCEFKGDVFTKDNLKHELSAVLQIGENLYLGPSGDIDDKIRHSCNPNCLLHIVGHRAFLYSLYVITPDMEITFDYSTSSTDSPTEWQMDCHCGAQNCRKKISGFYYLDKELQEEYKRKGMAAQFIRTPIFMRK